MNTVKGFQDTLPAEMENRRECEKKLTQIFQQWGYQEIDTPTLEYYDILTNGTGPGLKDKMFKFFNVDGEIIVLRPDMTTPIARVAATKLNIKREGFKKLYYLNNVFRKINTQADDQQEFHQAGIELLGLDSRLADVEIIAVAIQALLNSGLHDFFIDIGSAKFFNAVMNQLPLTDYQKNKLRKTVMNKDFVLLENLLSSCGLTRDEQKIILRLPHWRGNDSVISDAEKIFHKKNKIAVAALQEIKDVYEYLKIFGLDKYILIDLGIIRDFDYYTGIIFEGYTSQSGSAICGGGRYDSLCQKFGKDIPSTGVAIGIERLLAALKQREGLPKQKLDDKKYFIRFPENLIKPAFLLAETLRKKGCMVEFELDFNRSKQDSMQYAFQKRIRYLIEIEPQHPDKIIKKDLQENKTERVFYE